MNKQLWIITTLILILYYIVAEQLTSFYKFIIGIAIFITLYCCFSTPLFEQAFKTKKKVK